MAKKSARPAEVQALDRSEAFEEARQRARATTALLRVIARKLDDVNAHDEAERRVALEDLSYLADAAVRESESTIEAMADWEQAP